MPSICTQLAARTGRLAAAQRAFWDAWKAVSSGDRARLKEAREAKRELEAARQEVVQITYASWAPRVRSRVILPEAYHLVTFEEEQYVEELADYYTHFRESTHEHVDGVTAVCWMPDGSLLSAGFDRTIKISHPDKLHEEMVTLNIGLYAATEVLLLPNNQFAVADENSTLTIWSKDLDGKYTREEILHVQGHAISNILHVPDGTWFVGTDDALLMGRVEEDGYRTWSKMEGHRGMALGMHPLSDGRIISAHGEGEVIVWKREGDTYVIESRLLSPNGYRSSALGIHANADGRIIVTDLFFGCEVWQVMENGTIAYQYGISLEDEFMDGMVLPDGSIALLSNDKIEVYVPGKEVRWRTLFRIGGDLFDIREDGVIAIANDQSVKVIVSGEHPDFEVEDEGV